jgi:hypothetical protein
MLRQSQVLLIFHLQTILASLKLMTLSLIPLRKLTLTSVFRHPPFQSSAGPKMPDPRQLSPVPDRFRHHYFFSFGTGLIGCHVVRHSVITKKRAELQEFFSYNIFDR